MSQPIKKQQILGIFGEVAGIKLLNWLNPCCDQFCTDVLACGGGGFSLPITTNLDGSIVATYDQTNNFLGVGLTGAGQVFDTGSGGYNLLVSIDSTSFGGSPNTTYTGYTTFGPGPAANALYSYNVSTDTAITTLSNKSSTAKSAQITLKADATTNKIEFVFDTGDYKFPTTSPSSGEVLGYTGANQLGWVSNTGGISIGDTIGGGPVSNGVLFVDNTGDLTTSGNFTFNAITNEFAVGSGNTLTVDPTLGVVATTASSVNAFSAVTSYGQAFQINTSGGMGQLIEFGDIGGLFGKSRFILVDSAKQINAILDGNFNVYRATGTTAKAFSVNTNNLGTGQLLVELGDVSGVVNNTKVIIDDSAKTIKFTGSEYQNSTVVLDTAVSTTYTVLDGDRIIYVDTNTAAATITLPSVSTDDKRLIKIKCIGANGVTIIAAVGGVDTGSLTTGQVGEWQALNSTITWQRLL